MNTVIYFVRHGKVNNPRNILYGRLPKFRLSSDGVKQIQISAKFLARKKITCVYASPLLRAKQTASIIYTAVEGMQRTSQLLIDVKTSWQGKKFEKLKKTNIDIYSNSQRKDGDETMLQVLARMERFIHMVCKQYPGKQIVAVSHADPILLLHAYFNNLPICLNSIRPPKNDITYGEVFKIEISKIKTTCTRLYNFTNSNT